MPLNTNPLEKYIYEILMLPYQIPGVMLCMTKNNEIIIDQAFGYANHKK